MVDIRGKGRDRRDQSPPARHLPRADAIEDDLAKPYMVEPLRREDVTMTFDGGVALIVTSAERAKDYPSLDPLKKGEIPYMIGRVVTDDGPLFVVGVDVQPEDAKVDTRLRATWDDVSDDVSPLRFTAA